MENNHSKPHAVLFPYPLQGHVIPAVHLAIKLASNGFTVTFVNTQAVHHQIIKSQSLDTPSEDVNIFEGVCKSSLDIRYVTISDGFPIGFDRSLNHDQFWEGVQHVFPAHVDELVAELVRSDPPVTCLIADTFFVWPTMIAAKYNLVNVSFWTEPVLVLTLYYHIYLLRENGHFASPGNHRQDTIDYIPGVKAIEPKDLMSYLQATDVTSVVHRIIYKAFEEVKRADFILCNTIQELESDTISALQEKQPTYAIGPIFPNGFTKSTVATSLWSEFDCIEWLNAKPDGSILYVSFGSYAHASKRDIEEIANGLLLSKVSFIWVLRPDIVSSNETQILPVGFEDEIKNRGLIVSWCSQIEVISHPAIGGFLTHCGWNSILESMWRGLPLLCYPLLTDQFTNRKLVVDGDAVSYCPLIVKPRKLHLSLLEDPVSREEHHINKHRKSPTMERNTISRKVNSSSPPSFSSSAAETVADIQDLLTEILLRVPARSVVRLKCISRHWYCLISNPEFRRRHILQNPNPKVSAFFSNTTQNFTFISLYKNPPRIFIHDLYPGNHQHSINPFKTLNELVQGNWNDFGLKILQSCNGLFLCVPFSTERRTYQYYYHTLQYYSIYVVNPTTNEFMAVSPPRVGKGTVFERYALAFDPSKSTHYKVICISTIHKHNWLHQVDVYSSETRSWRLLETSFASRDIEMQFDGRSREGGVYCNGAVHWIRDEKELPISVGEDGNSLVRENADLVHYYDIAEERLGLAIPSAPVVVSGYYASKFPKFDHRYFGESGGHLYLIDVYKDCCSSQNYLYDDCKAEFDVMEMGKDYSGWFVKYHVDLNPVVAAFRGYYDHFSRFYVLFLDGEGKEEQDQQQQEEVSSSLLFHIPGKVISYNLRSKTCKTYVDLSIKDYFLVGGHSYSYIESLASL